MKKSPEVAGSVVTEAAGGDLSGNPAASAPAARTAAELTWTCPACGGTFPLEERWVHKPKCPGRSSASFEPPMVTCGRCGAPVATTATAREAHAKICQPDPTPSPSASPAGPKLDMDRLRRRVLASVRDAGRSVDPQGYLMALVLRVAEEQGVPAPSEAEASQIVRDLARREPAIARILEKVVG